MIDSRVEEKGNAVSDLTHILSSDEVWTEAEITRWLTELTDDGSCDECSLPIEQHHLLDKALCFNAMMDRPAL